MNIIEAIKARKSVRGYKPDPVPKEVLAEILEIASRAPSPLNIQPWEFTVIAGEVMDNIKKANLEKAAAGEAPTWEGAREEYNEIQRRRQVALGVQLFTLMGIAREDREKRGEWMRRGFRFLDAPAAIIISMDKTLGQRSHNGIGAVSQTIALAALHYGLGTCIQGQGIMYPDAIRKFTGIPESKQICICLAIGYPDPDFPANKVESEREPIENITTWCGL